MAQLTTADEWWAEFARIKTDIQEWGPTSQNVGDLPIHLVPYKILRNLYTENAGIAFWELVDGLQEKKDTRLYWILQSIWEDAPDQPYIHSWKSWGAFCDLCSEGPACLFEEEQTIQ